MSKPANKTLIGAFVVGATALLLLAIGVFGSGKLFQTTSRYVLFFDGSMIMNTSWRFIVKLRSFCTT